MNSKLQTDKNKQNSNSDSLQIERDSQNSTKSMKSSNYQDFDHIIVSNRKDVEHLEREIDVLKDLNVDRVMKNNPKKCSSEAYSAALEDYLSSRISFVTLIFTGSLFSLGAVLFLAVLVSYTAELSDMVICLVSSIICFIMGLYAIFAIPDSYKEFKAAKAILDEQKKQYKLGMKYDNGVVQDKLDGVEF